MPKPTVFTKEQILDAAFAIFKEEGIGNISARKLAARMGSSTAPIYTSFKNIEDIQTLLLERALSLLLEYTEKEYTVNIFLNIGVGMLEFARDYKILYRTLFMESSEHQYILQEFFQKSLLQMEKEKTLKIFNEKELTDILRKMEIFTHGMAAFLCAGMLEDESRDFFVHTLNETGAEVISAAAYRKGVLEQFITLNEKGGCES